MGNKPGNRRWAAVGKRVEADQAENPIAQGISECEIIARKELADYFLERGFTQATVQDNGRLPRVSLPGDTGEQLDEFVSIHHKIGKGEKMPVAVQREMLSILAGRVKWGLIKAERESGFSSGKKDDLVSITIMLERLGKQIEGLAAGKPDHQQAK